MYCNCVLNNRISQLNAVLDAVMLVRQRIGLFLEPLDSVLGVLRLENELFRVPEDLSFEQAWQRAIQNADCIRREEKETIARFPLSLGKTEKSGQTALCDAMAQKIRQYKRRAEEEKHRYARPAGVLPVFAGIAVILLFI